MNSCYDSACVAGRVLDGFLGGELTRCCALSAAIVTTWKHGIIQLTLLYTSLTQLRRSADAEATWQPAQRAKITDCTQKRVSLEDQDAT